jgi:predicted ArsR family transcriptional regulator
MSTLQRQARALGDPTRHRIYQYLVDSEDGADVAELTEHVGLNHNAVRQHLAKLVDAGLVVEGTAPPAGRGRPRLRYTVDPASDSRWGPTGPYERLAVLLTELARSGETPVEVGRRAGRRLQRSAPPAADPTEAFAAQMARQGFDPTVHHRGDRVSVTLQTCPFTSAVLTDPEVICDLHLGLALGVAEEVGGLVVEELIPQDPRHARCRLRCRLT